MLHWSRILSNLSKIHGSLFIHTYTWMDMHRLMDMWLHTYLSASIYRYIYIKCIYALHAHIHMYIQHTFIHIQLCLQTYMISVYLDFHISGISVFLDLKKLIFSGTELLIHWRQAFIYCCRLHQVWRNSWKTTPYMGKGKVTKHAQNLKGCEKCNPRKAVGNI